MLDAAKAMKLSAKDLLELQIIDEIIDEPVGGAHRDKNLMLESIKISIKKNLQYFKTISPEEIYNERKNKFLRIGRNKGFIENLEELSSLARKSDDFQKFVYSRRFVFVLIGILLIVLLSLTFLS